MQCKETSCAKNLFTLVVNSFLFFDIFVTMVTTWSVLYPGWSDAYIALQQWFWSTSVCRDLSLNQILSLPTFAQKFLRGNNSFTHPGYMYQFHAIDFFWGGIALQKFKVDKTKSEAESLSFLHLSNLHCSQFTAVGGSHVLPCMRVCECNICCKAASRWLPAGGAAAAVSEPLRLFRGLPSLPPSLETSSASHYSWEEEGWEAGGSRDRQQRSLQSSIWQGKANAGAQKLSQTGAHYTRLYCQLLRLLTNFGQMLSTSSMFNQSLSILQLCEPDEVKKTGLFYLLELLEPAIVATVREWSQSCRPLFSLREYSSRASFFNSSQLHQESI